MSPTSRVERALPVVVHVNAEVERTFENAVRELEPFVRRRANRLAHGDEDFAEELMQEAWIKLWELDPLRFDPDNRVDHRYVRSSIADRMNDHALRERSRVRSDDVRLEVRLR